MFSLIKLIVWMAGVLALAYFILGYFGYAVNMDYFSASRSACEEKLKECANNTLRQGINNAQCEMDCVNPSLIIKKK